MSPIVVAFVTACTALIAAIVGPFITFRIGKAQINAAVLSSNRQKWIERFRDLVAGFCSQAITISVLRDRMIEDGRIVVGLDPELLERVETLTKTFTTIRLMANPIEADHQALMRLLSAIMTTLRTAPIKTDLENDLQAGIDEVVAATQVILKREWVRVKRGE